MDCYLPAARSLLREDGTCVELHSPAPVDFDGAFSSPQAPPSPRAGQVVLHTPEIQIVLHRDAFVSAPSPPFDQEEADVTQVCDAPDEERREVPDPMPSKQHWPSTAGLPGYPKAGPGRPKGTGLHVRDSLEEIALVIFCRDLMQLFSEGELSNLVSAEHLASLAALRQQHAHCSDKKMSDRSFSLVPFAGVGLIAKFGRDEIRGADGPEQAVVVELRTQYNDELLCACSSPEQCLLVGCTHADAIKSAWRRVSLACAVAPAVLLRATYERIGDPLNEGDARICGETLCAVRGAGGNWPWMLVRKSRAAFWTCMSCVEQGLLCSHAAAARAAYSSFLDKQEDVSDDEEEETESSWRKQLVVKYQRSHRPRFAVPSLAAFATEQKLRSCALTDMPFDLKAPDFCPVPGCLRAYKLARRSGIVKAVVEFEEGAAPCDVQWWLCPRCNVKVFDDGSQYGIVFGSIETGFTEPFLFNVAAGLVANGSCMSATVQLRQHVIELSGTERLPLKANAVRTLPIVRQALMLYLELVVEGLPVSVFSCSSCVQPGGSYKSLSFDGLYMGIRAKHRRELKRIRLPVGMVRGAVAVASLVKDGAIVIALARVLRQATADSNGKAEHPRAKSVRAATGVIYAIAMLYPAALESKDKTASDCAAHQWDPVADGKVDGALVAFVREVLRGQDVAVQLGRSVVNAPAKVRDKLPTSIVATLAQFVRSADKDAASSSPPGPRPDARLAAALDEPALADTGGALCDRLQLASKVRLHPDIPCTVNGAAKVIEFVRALCAEPIFVWCQNGDWGAVDALANVLDDPNWTQQALQGVLRDQRVREQRVLRGAIACLAPALLASSTIRRALRKVLRATRASFRRYLRFVKDETDVDDEDDQPLTRQQVASSGFTRALTPAEFDSLWLAPRISVSELGKVYGTDFVASLRDYHQSGVFCPALPLLRPGFSFVDGGRLTEEDSLCEKDFLSATGWTAGTFGVFCCCSHPMCIAVLMMDGHEGPRMPLDFLVSRLPSLPSNIIYDFACGYLKSAICRTPRVAVFVKAVVDVFHFRKGHKTCSAASSPNAYESLRGANTSSAEQRNAATKRLKPFIRLLNQRNFLTFSAYQQGVCNIAALHRQDRDAALPGARVSLIGWPLWYRESFGSNKRNKQGSSS